MSQQNLEQYYRSVKQSLTNQNYKTFENLILPQNIPKSDDTFIIKKAESDKNLTDQQKKLFFIIDLFSKLHNCNKEDLAQFYENLLLKIRDSTILSDDFEFQHFFRAFFKKIRKDLLAFDLISEDKLKNIISIVREIFVSQKKSKFFSVLPIILHQLMFLYFAVNHYQQCSKMLETMVSILNLILNNAHRLEVFNINYYLARLDHFNGDSELVEERLEVALKNAFNNRQRRKILHLLIPIKINKGFYPTKILCEAFKLKNFQLLSKSIKTGNLAEYEILVKANTSFWIKNGTLFMLGQCKNILLTNLIRRIHVFMEKPLQIDIGYIELAFNFQRLEKFSRSEVVAIISGLIIQGHINGVVYAESYILHFNPKKEPFN